LKRPGSYPKTILVLLALAIGSIASAREEPLLESPITTTTLSSANPVLRNRIETGFLSSGADAEDLDEGIFGWDYVTYLNYRYQLNDTDRIRLRTEYWDFLSGNYRRYTSLKWRRQLPDVRAIFLMASFTDEHDGFRGGMAFAGYEGLLGRDFQYSARLGLGTNDSGDFTQSLVLEVQKPLTRTTLLRVSNDSYYSTSHFRSNAAKINVIQALSHRLALNLGYRLYLSNSGSRDIDNLTSDQVSAGLAYQFRENLYLFTEYAHYWNTSDTTADSGLLGTRWNITRNFSTIAAYRLQNFHGGPVNNGIQLGFAYDF
jgi:hypothetical protein